MRDDKIHLKQ